MLNEQETRQAQQLYCRWFAKFPKMKNPTDINSRTKYDFAMQIGWEKMRLMMTARKANTDKNGYPYPWTKADYWTQNNRSEGSNND